METLKNKQFASFDYLSRYSNVPYYFDTLENRDIYGLGSNLKKNTEWIAHKVKPSDNLDSLALYYYNNPTYWWILAFFNNIQDPFVPLGDQYQVLKIPNISSIAFNNERS